MAGLQARRPAVWHVLSDKNRMNLVPWARKHDMQWTLQQCLKVLFMDEVAFHFYGKEGRPFFKNESMKGKTLKTSKR